jgi:uncharacterized protein YbjQ (UPF0145 family)
VSTVYLGAAFRRIDMIEVDGYCRQAFSHSSLYNTIERRKPMTITIRNLSRLLNGFLCFAALCTGGCGFRYSSDIINRQIAEDRLTATKSSEVILTEADITDKKYNVICDLTVVVKKMTLFNADPTREDVNIKLREEAAKVGADAVIFVRAGSAGISALSWGEMEGKGRAVKFIQ